MLTLFEISRLIHLVDDYCHIMEYAVSSQAEWVDICDGKNDISYMKAIKAKLEEEYDKRIKQW